MPPPDLFGDLDAAMFPLFLTCKGGSHVRAVRILQASVFPWAALFKGTTFVFSPSEACVPCLLSLWVENLKCHLILSWFLRSGRGHRQLVAGFGTPSGHVLAPSPVLVTYLE